MTGDLKFKLLRVRTGQSYTPPEMAQVNWWDNNFRWQKGMVQTECDGHWCGQHRLQRLFRSSCLPTTNKTEPSTGSMDFKDGSKMLDTTIR